MPNNKRKLCGKVIHFSQESAQYQSDSLKGRYGKSPNIYKCQRCSDITDRLVIHVGYGFETRALNKKSRRHHKAVGSRKRRRARRMLSELAGEL